MIPLPDEILLLESLKPEQADSKILLYGSGPRLPGPLLLLFGNMVVSCSVLLWPNHPCLIRFVFTGSPAHAALPFLVPAGLTSGEDSRAHEVPVSSTSHRHYFPRIWKTLGKQHRPFSTVSVSLGLTHFMAFSSR